MTTFSNAHSPAVFARLKEELSVADLEKQNKKVKVWVFNSILSMMAIILITASFAAIVMGVATTFQDGLETISLSSIVMTVSFIGSGITFLVLASDRKKKAEKKALQNSIQKSRRTAKTLGESVVPVLTKQHVDARFNIDAALRTKLDEKGSKWSQSDSDRIGVILFQDLMQESTIHSLILERGINSASEIESALREMETNSVKPVQAGWL